MEVLPPAAGLRAGRAHAAPPSSSAWICARRATARFRFCASEDQRSLSLPFSFANSAAAPATRPTLARRHIAPRRREPLRLRLLPARGDDAEDVQNVPLELPALAVLLAAAPLGQLGARTLGDICA